MGETVPLSLTEDRGGKSNSVDSGNNQWMKIKFWSTAVPRSQLEAAIHQGTEKEAENREGYTGKERRGHREGQEGKERTFRLLRRSEMTEDYYYVQNTNTECASVNANDANQEELFMTNHIHH